MYVCYASSLVMHLLKQQQPQLQQQSRTWNVSACTAVAIAHVWGDTQDALFTDAANTHKQQWQHKMCVSVSPKKQDDGIAVSCPVQCEQ
jgi:hypothetical protein